MMRFIFILIAALMAPFPVSQASEIGNPAPEIRAYESNSTDELGLLQTLIQAKKLYELQDYQKAVRLFSLIVKYDPTLESAVRGLAETYIALSRPEAALELLEASPVQSKALKRIEILAKALNMKTKAREPFLKTAVEITPDPRLFNLYAKALVENGNYSAARLAYRKAETLGQKPGVFLNNLGMLELKQGNTKRAASLLFRALNAAPEEPRFNNNYRLALLLEGDYIKALDKIESDRAADFLTDGAYIALSQNEIDLAKLLFEKANKISPVFHPRAQYGLALLK
jgi:Flp pilus assembly protein TadD